MAAREFAAAAACFEKNGRSEEWRRNRIGVASSIMNTALCHDSLGNSAAAREQMEKALKIQEEEGDLGEQARCVMNIGNILFRTGDLERALSLFERAKELAIRAKLPDIEAGCITNAARVHRFRGDFPRALAEKEKAAAVFERLGMKEELSIVLVNLGQHCLGVGEYRRALGYLERALALSREIGDDRNVNLLTNLSMVYDALGRSKERQEYSDRAVRAARETGDRYGLAVNLGCIADTLAKEGRLDEARTAIEEAMEIRRALGDRAGLAHSLGSLAFLEESAKRYEKAIARREEALAIAREVGYTELEIRCLWAIAESTRHLGRSREAALRAREAVERLGDLFGGLGDVEAASIRARWSGIFGVGLGAAFEAGSAELVAFFLESGRAGALMESLGDRERLAASVLPPALQEAVAAARGRETAARAALQEATDRGTLGWIAAARKELGAANIAWREAVERVQREAKAAAAVLYPRAASLAEIQGALRPGEAMVLYGRPGAEGVALVATAGEARLVRLGPGKAIDEAASALSLHDPAGEHVEALGNLSRLLVEPLALDPGVRRLLVSPSDSTAFVPFAALVPGRDVVFVPSASAYLHLPEAGRSAGGRVLALGDPEYASAGRAGTRGGPALTPLPATRAEAKAVGTEVLLGAAASETGLRARLAPGSRWRAVHLACHGLQNPEDATRSLLALAADDGNDGMISVLDVYGLKVEADLVVLSGCETARGREVQAEGVMGFPRAFILAGAPSILVSLWKVDDEATRALMEAFYRRWNPPGGKGLSAAESLRRAQEEVRDQERWRHPAFWAAWQIWGRGD